MSNIYIQEPPALGKVLLKTSAGKIDIELWTKEAPKACRNFIQLCMEGYYKGTIFHRVVPGFIVQGGDPNGDGTGGESIYGEPFKDEFHQRLRFNRRGLVAMANAGKDDNASQFFFTLGATPELQNKHTIFGKVTGDTIYNVLKLSEGEIAPDDRPDHPHKITGVEVLINPFEDIVPRVVQKDDTDVKPKKKKKEAVAVKNLGLLSFGDDAEEDETESVTYKGKSKSSHDLLDDPKLGKKTAAELGLEDDIIETIEEPTESTSETITNIKEKLQTKKRNITPYVEVSDSKKKRKESDSESERSEEEVYYIGKERDEERIRERDKIREEIKQLKKEMKGSDKKSQKNELEIESKTKMATPKEPAKPLDGDYAPSVDTYKKLKDKVPAKGKDRNKRSKTKSTPKKPWVKNLYENREYPDNYTDSKFLEQLQKNLFIQKVTLSQAILGSFRIILRLCLCILFAILFVFMYNNWIKNTTVILLSISLTTVGYVLYILTKGLANGFKHLKTVLAYLVLGYLLSPILHTLTDTVSTDTIFAWAVIMNLVHLVFFDYGVSAAIVSKSLSINAAVFGSVCLVSRLHSQFDAFILLTDSVITFVLSPQLFNIFYDTKLFLLIFFSIFVFTLVMLKSVSVVILLYFLVLVAFLSLYCPYKFVVWQKYKENIYGPWDEAVINDSDDLDECLNVESL